MSHSAHNARFHSGEFAKFKQSKYFEDLDGLRAVSILLVIFFHTTGNGSNLAVSGVNLFFAISGFLITTLLVRERDHQGSINLRMFYVRRTLRIFPVYYAVILVQILLLHYLTFPEEIERDFGQNLIYFMTYTQNWFVTLQPDHPVLFYHAWSLATEEQFYLFWPIALCVLRRLSLCVLLMCVLLIIDVVSEIAFAAPPAAQLLVYQRMITSIAAPICMGSIYAILCNSERHFSSIYSLIGRTYIPLIAILFAILGIIIQSSLLEHFALTTLVVSCCIQDKTFISRFLRNKTVSYIGLISYGMYLMHMLALNATKRFILPHADHHGFLVFSVTFLITLAAAAASFHFFEQPFLHLRKKFRPTYSPQTS